MQSVGEVMAIGRTFPESLQRRCAVSNRVTSVSMQARVRSLSMR